MRLQPGKTAKKSVDNLIGWRIWAIAACFYLYEFMQRVSPAIMIPDLMLDFQVSAEALGSLSAFYYYAYAICQIPAGICCDRYSLRKTLSWAAVITLIGSCCLTFTADLSLAKIARACIGFGSGFAFVACLKLASTWFASHRFPLLVGLTNLCGVCGAILGGAPLSFLVESFGWRFSLACLSAIALILCFVLYYGIKDQPAAETEEPPRALLKDLQQVFKCKYTWLAALYASLLVAPIAALPELWSIPFFIEAHHLSRPLAAFASSMIFVGIACGGPLIGFMANRTKTSRAYTSLMQGGTFIALCLLIIFIYGPPLPLWLLSFILFFFGAATSNMLLCFSLVVEQHPSHLRGIALGFTNTLVMAGGAFFQPLIGYLLDNYSSGQLEDNLPYFNTQDYRMAFSVLVFCLVLGLILSFTLKRSSP